MILDLRPVRRNDCALRPTCPSCTTPLGGVVTRDQEPAAEVQLECPSCRFLLVFRGPGLLVDRRTAVYSQCPPGPSHVKPFRPVNAPV